MGVVNEKRKRLFRKKAEVTKKAWQGKQALRLRGEPEAERASLQLQHREQARISPRRADTTLRWCVCGQGMGGRAFAHKWGPPVPNL